VEKSQDKTVAYPRSGGKRRRKEEIELGAAGDPSPAALLTNRRGGRGERSDNFDEGAGGD